MPFDFEYLNFDVLNVGYLGSWLCCRKACKKFTSARHFVNVRVILVFQPYVEKMETSTDEDKKNMYSRIIVSWPKAVQYTYESVVNKYESFKYHNIESSIFFPSRRK